MAANLMDLVRELKTLNGRKKAGETLTPAEEERRKELKTYLRSTLEQQGAGGEDSAVKEAPTARSAAPKAVSMPSAAPQSPPPRSVSVTSSNPPVQVPQPVAPRGVSVTSSNPPMQVPQSVAPRGVSVTSSNPPVQMPGSVPPRGVSVTSSNPPVQLNQPSAAPGAQPFVPKKNAFAIDLGLADALIGDAMKSDAVNKVDPWANRQAHASQAEIEESNERADAAIRANKKRARATGADEAVSQLKEIEAAYTPPVDALTFEQYYNDYENEGFVLVDAKAAGGLKPIDPQMIELQRAGVEAQGAVSGAVQVPRGLAFLDDFPALYSRRILPPPDDELVSDSADPNLIVPGKRKVTVHLMNGEKKQGSVRQIRRGDLGFKLEPIGSGLPEEMSIAQCKAVFIHLAASAPPREVQGRQMTVTFRDGRSAQGVSDDYQPGAPVFSIVPPAGRGQFERVIINGAFVQAVS